MKSTKLAVSVKGLTKRYRISSGLVKHNTLAEAMMQRARNPLARAKAEAKRAQVEAEQEKEWAAAEVRRIEARARDPRSDEEIYQARVIADFAEARRQGWGCE